MPFQKGNKEGGRKPLAVEKSVLQYYMDALPKAFKIIDKMLNSKVKGDKKWAVERLEKGWVKSIPQMISGDPNNETPIPIYMSKSIKK